MAHVERSMGLLIQSLCSRLENDRLFSFMLLIVVFVLSSIRGGLILGSTALQDSGRVSRAMPCIFGTPFSLSSATGSDVHGTLFIIIVEQITYKFQSGGWKDELSSSARLAKAMDGRGEDSSPSAAVMPWLLAPWEITSTYRL